MVLHALGGSRSPVCPLTLLLALALSPLAQAKVVLLPVSSETAFPDATAPNALSFACAETAGDLERHFLRKGLRFSRQLLHERTGHPACHVYYEPTVPGFRALPDNRPIQGLYVAIDPVSFIVRLEANGDSLSIAKQVLPRIARPLHVTLSVPGDFDPGLWPEALRFHFGESKHRFQVRKSGSSSSHPWAQDHQKAGEVDGKLRILTPRRLFEGRREDGETFGPMLDKLDDPVFARSKLSWEGGDIQFVNHPKDPSRLVMLHGGVGRYYWGLGLTPAEASYVLVSELGADMAVDLTSTGLHADYVAAALPDAGAVLVSELARGDAELFRAAADYVARLFGKHPTPAVLDLERFLKTWDGNLAASAGPLRGLVRGIERSLDSFQFPEDPAIEADLTAYVDRYCNGDAASCFQGDARIHMLSVAPDVLRRSTNQSANMHLFAQASERMLAVMEAQLPYEPSARELALDQAAETLEALGFRVIRTPYIYAPKMHERWPGVSYANSFVEGRKIFMPAVGLGKYEARIFAEIQQAVGEDYQVIPVNALASVLDNGGAHCVFGIVREPAPARSRSE